MITNQPRNNGRTIVGERASDTQIGVERGRVVCEKLTSGEQKGLVNMENTKELLQVIKTRGDFRRLTECGQEELNARHNAVERLWPVWEALSEAYGNAFTNQFGDEPSDVWAGGLAEYSLDRIRDAIAWIIKSGDRYAPNLATVISNIESGDSWEHKKQSRPANEVLCSPIIDLGDGRALPPPNIDKSPEEYLKEMRELFK